MVDDEVRLEDGEDGGGVGWFLLGLAAVDWARYGDKGRFKKSGLKM